MNDNNDTGASAPQLSPLTDADSLCREFLDAIPEAAALFDPLGRLMAVNGAWRQLVTACHPAARALAADAVAAGSTADGGASAGIRAVLEGREAIFVMPCAERGGEAGHCDFQLQATPMQLGAWRGALVRLLDGSAELQLQRVNRALRMLSRCNSALFLAKDEDSLLKEITDIALTVGQYRFVWIGFAEHDEARTLRVAARAGCEDFDNNLGGELLSWDQRRSSGRGLAAETIRTARPVICEDLGQMSVSAAQKRRIAGLGLNSVLNVPLRGRDGVLGLLSLYSQRLGGFAEDEVSLCQELADNLAYGIEHLREVSERQLLEEAVLNVAASVTSVTGSQFFSELSASVADTLGAEVCIISRVIADNPAQVMLLGGVQGGRTLPCHRYDIEDAACQALLSEPEFAVTSGVQWNVSPSSLLAAAGVESYVGVRLNDRAGEMTGMMCVAFRHPLRKRAFVLSMLRIFATRAAAELEREKANSHLYEQAALLDKAQDAIIVLSLDYRVNYWNKGAEKLYGWTVDEVVGRPPNIGRHDNHRDATEAAMAATLDAGEWRGQFTQQRKGGEQIVVEAHWSLVRSDEGSPRAIFCIHSDITEKQALEAQLQQSQRLESLGQLMGGMAHDFNNLLTVILGNAELLAEELGEESPLGVLVEMICSASRRGANLTRSLLAVARRQTLAPSAVDVADLLEEMAELLNRTLRDNIRVRIKRATDVGPALVDQAQLESAVINLCVNARDAMPDGGELTIEILNHTLADGPYARQRDLAAGDYLMLRVTDTGSGISPENLSRLFDPFFTTKDKDRGTGLGLSMVYGFVRQSRGDISVVSTQGVGTCVTMLLPRAESPTQAGGEPAEPGAEELTRKDTVILVVEDDDMVRSFAVRQLRDAGYQVLQAASGREALTVFDASPRVDLLFTDVIMPGELTGPQLARLARERCPGLRVLFTSGYTEDALFAESGSDSAALLLDKPYYHAELMAKIRQVLHGSA